MNTYYEIQQTIQRYRNEKKITVVELADRIGMAPGTLGHKLRGDRKFSLEEVLKIANELGLLLPKALQQAIPQNNSKSNLVQVAQINTKTISDKKENQKKLVANVPENLHQQFAVKSINDPNVKNKGDAIIKLVTAYVKGEIDLLVLKQSNRVVDNINKQLNKLDESKHKIVLEFTKTLSKI